MAEKELTVTSNQGANGKVYRNVNLKESLSPETQDFAIVEKTYPDGKKHERTGSYGPYSFYSVNFNYNGEQVGVLMNQKMYDAWLPLPLGKVKISTKLVKTKKGLFVQVFDFETVA